ncbi:MAG: dolichyl-phosphate-mannose--protein mannosyltransferase, partial [Pseudonocardiaceae bacterium]
MVREASSDTPMSGAIPPSPTKPADSLQWLMPRPLTDSWRGWIVALGLTLVAGLVRLWNLGQPTDGGTPVFDEKHYAPQAWQMLRNGGVEDNAGYELVVHPPLGKQLMALGELLMGYNGWGWRLSAALAGTVCVLLIVRIVRRMTRSTLLGGIAGVLLIADGVSHVQSRIGMLDIFLTVFVLAAFGCLVIDREQAHARLATVVREGRVADTNFGPRLGVRWWRFGAGVFLGLACGTKWSGIYYVVAFAALSLAWDAFARRGAGVRCPWTGTLARDLGPASWAMAVVPVGAYLATWWAWLSSETGVDRHAVGGQIGTGGAFSFVPGPLRALWHYSAAVLRFHEGLFTPADPHPWESKPWSWPMGLRPMLYYYESGGDAPGFVRDDCLAAVMLVGTPELWWVALPFLGGELWLAVLG